MRPRIRLALLVVAALLLASVATPAAGQLYELAPPTNLRVTALDHTRATIAWDPSPDAERYLVMWSVPFDWAEVTDTSITIPIQHPGATYHVSVRAESSEDVSVFQGLTFRAPNAPPPPVPPTPTGVEVTTAPGSLTVTWEPSFVDGEEADAYVVRLRPGHSGIVTTATTLTHQVPPGGDFSVTVSARNGLFSTSQPSAPIDVTVPPSPDWTPLTAPGRPQVTVEGGLTTRIEWAPASGGAPPITYRLNYRFPGDRFDSWLLETSHTSVDVQVEIGDVRGTCAPRHAATIWVTALSHGTTSPPSETALLCL